MDNQQAVSHLVLTVAPEKLPLFTTVLQSGIDIMTPAGTNIGKFLDVLPGFTSEYLTNTVQTIFHNGTAIDNLTTELTGETPVLALSAAMPGLAGAIFRKNSFHAALRSETKIAENSSVRSTPIKVKLKLFNTIALERGKELFSLGVRLQATTLASFFEKRPGLMEAILAIQLDNKSIDITTFSQKLVQLETINLKILEDMTLANG